MAIGTQLNTDDLTGVRVVVGVDSVEFHCANTEVEMYEAALELFIQTGQDALPRLRPSSNPIANPTANLIAPVPDQADAVAVDGPQVSGTWVICEATEPLHYLLLRDAVELHWGPLTWTITARALSRLLGPGAAGARRSHPPSGLRRGGRAAGPGDPRPEDPGSRGEP